MAKIAALATAAAPKPSDRSRPPKMRPRKMKTSRPRS
jgi:hypothetical protein